MKIAEVVPFFLPRVGMPNHVFEISKRLADDHDVWVINGDFFGDYNVGRKIMEFENFKIIHLKNLVKLGGYGFCYRLDQAFRKKFDIVHAHSFAWFSSDQSLVIAKKQGIPTIYTPHGFYWEYKSLMKKFYRYYFKRFIAKNIDVGIALCPKFVSDLELLGIESIRVISNGVDPEEFNIPFNEVYLGKFGVSAPYLLFVGRISFIKGLDLLVRALKVVRKNFKVELVIVGPDHGYKKILIKLIKKLDLAKHIHFLGKVTREDLIQIYKGCELIVLPTRGEGLPLTLLEGMCAGKPIVATKVDCIPWAIEDCGILVEKENIGQLAEGISLILGDKQLQNKLGQKGNKRVLEKFTWNKIAKDIESLYFKLGGI
jgi:glycosyltransferase involved in cell wall biosynthesis